MGWKDLTAKTFASIRELNGISARTMEEHYELYKGYIGKTNEIQKKLDTVDRARREPDLSATCARCASTCRSRSAA